MIYRFLNRLQKIYWKIIKPNTMGVKVIAEYENQIVLVKPLYSDLWHLPGGGVNKRETVYDAAIREFYEECGVKVADMRLEGIYSNFSEGKNDHIAIFSAHLSSPRLVASMEIEQSRLFDLNNLPPISLGNKRRIDEYISHNFTNGLW